MVIAVFGWNDAVNNITGAVDGMQFGLSIVASAHAPGIDEAPS
jgi:hypothetical protein